MKTYEDLLAVGEDEVQRQNFILAAINDHKRSPLYEDAKNAWEYYCRRNVTILRYQKFLYKMSGEVVPDNYSANYKISSAFYPIFVKQEVSHLLGNGATFNDDATKDKIGGNMFDTQLVKAAKAAVWGGVSFGFFNLDHIDVFNILEFVPLIGEEDGGLHAGIRFWQIDKTKPLRATLYEQDGYTEYKWDDGKVETLKQKTKYVQIVQHSEADGIEIIDGRNYDGFPVVPLWNGEERQSSLIGLQSGIDAYDLIKSGFANDLDDVSQIYWILENAGGMDEEDVVKFLDSLRRTHGAALQDYDTKAQPQTIDIPYQAREVALDKIRDDLYRDAMALDTDRVSAGSITATAIEAAYENLTLKCDDFETCIVEFVNEILKLIGIEDSPTFKRSKIINMLEDTQMVLQAAQYLDNETILNHLPFLNIDEIDEILDRLTEEEAERFEDEEGEEDNSVAEEAEALDTMSIIDEYGEDVIKMLEDLIGEM